MFKETQEVDASAVITYSTAAVDSSNIKAVDDGDTVAFTYAGTQLIIQREDLSAFAALVATVNGADATPEETTTPEQVAPDAAPVPATDEPVSDTPPANSSPEVTPENPSEENSTETSQGD